MLQGEQTTNSGGDAVHAALLARAIALSVENVARGGGPFGAVVARNGEIIAEGQNAVTLTHDPTAHAEVVVIRAACARLQTFTLAGCVLYTSCEPCPMCLAAAYWARLDAIHFAATQDDAARAGFDDAFLYNELRLPLADRALPITAAGPNAQAAANEAFAAWTARAERVRY